MTKQRDLFPGFGGQPPAPKAEEPPPSPAPVPAPVPVKTDEEDVHNPFADGDLDPGDVASVAVVLQSKDPWGDALRRQVRSDEAQVPDSVYDQEQGHEEEP